MSREGNARLVRTHRCYQLFRPLTSTHNATTFPEFRQMWRKGNSFIEPPNIFLISNNINNITSGLQNLFRLSISGGNDSISMLTNQIKARQFCASVRSAGPKSVQGVSMWKPRPGKWLLWAPPMVALTSLAAHVLNSGALYKDIS